VKNDKLRKSAWLITPCVDSELELEQMFGDEDVDFAVGEHDGQED